MTEAQLQALMVAEATFRRYAHHHFAKGDGEKMAENFALADQMAAAQVCAESAKMAASPYDSDVMRLGKLWAKARSVHPDDRARQNETFFAALGVFAKLVTASELFNLQAEVERLTAGNEALKKNIEPLTDAEKRAMWVMATIDQCSHESCYLRGIADCESAHGIGEKK